MVSTPQTKVGKKHLVKAIKSCCNDAKVDDRGFKRMCIYYTGHSNIKGNWVVSDGEISLKDICH